MFVPALHATLTAIVILWIAAFVADKSAWGQQSDELAILRTQADALAKEGKRKEAFVAHRTLASRAEQAEIAAAGKAGTKTGEALGNLAWHAVLAEQFQEALAAADRGLLLAPELRAIEGNRAHALMFLGRVDEARAIHLANKGKPVSSDDDSLWEDALAGDFDVFGEFGLHHPAVPEFVSLLGIQSAEVRAGLTALRQRTRHLYDDGKYSEALPVAEHYVSVAEKYYGQEHLQFATALIWLGVVRLNLDQHLLAEAAYQQVLAIREKRLGANLPAVGTNLIHLADLYREQGRYVEAMPLYRRAVAIRVGAGPS
jgi:tetratricopeptide (TPR) repeat protein